MAVVTVSGSIASLNVTPGRVLRAMFVAPLTWMVPLTVGAVVSGVARVVQDHTKSPARALPERSRAPPAPPLTVAV